MKVKYRNKTIDIPNQSLDGDFCSHWNCYDINIIKQDFRKGTDKEYIQSHKYECYVQNPMGAEIVLGHSDSTIKKCLQVAIDNISVDIDDLMNRLEDLDESQESRYEIAYWLGMMEQL